MTRFIHFLLLAWFGLLGIGANGCAPVSGEYRGSASATYSSYSGGDDYYYGSLDRYGTWVEISTYGQVWCPLDVSVGWRPYTVGSWAYTDYGWMWIADDPWGYIPYHYGRWTFDSYYGWVWVPGDVWAPAWVSWRYGDGWVGWAPLPPDVGWRVGFGLTVDAYSLDSRIDSYRWCFAPARDITSTNIRARVAPVSRNVTFLSITNNVTNYTVINSRPAERGLRPDLIEQDTGRRITPYHVVESKTPRGSRGAVIQGRTIEIHRPAEEAGSKAKERVRSFPRERARPAQELIRRQEGERSKFEEQMQGERRELVREHERELREPPRGVSRAELARRQKAEMQAQKEREDRERKAIEERTKRLKKRAEEQGRGDEARDRDRDQNRGRGRNRGNGDEG